MGFLKWLLGGFIGAAIGGAIWVAIGHFANAEVGYVAWAIGLFAGIGVRMLGRDSEGSLPGIAAAFAAIVGVLGAKYMVVSLALSSALETEKPPQLGHSDLVQVYADQVVEDWTAEGKELTWPQGSSIETAENPQDYPAGVWAEADQRLKEIPMDQKRQELKELQVVYEAQFKEAIKKAGPELKLQLLKQNLGAYDLLWFALATFTAFRVGAGGTD